MSRRIKFVAIGSALVLALAFAGVALAQSMHHGRHGGFDSMLNHYSQALNLSTDQQDQIKSIWTKEKSTLQPLFQQMRQSHSQMESLTNNGAFDEAKVRALATQQAQTMVELEVEHARIKSEMMQVLTPDQKAKFAQLQAEHQQRWQQHKQGMEGPPSPEE